MALLTGMRQGEILGMKWECVNFTDRTITAVNTKNGLMHQLPLSEKLYDILVELKAKNSNDEYIFTNPDTNTRYKSIGRGFRNILKLADIKNFTFHDLRHTSATRLVSLNIPLPVIQSILNHKKIQTTMHYAHTMKGQQNIALEALSNFEQKN